MNAFSKNAPALLKALLDVSWWFGKIPRSDILKSSQRLLIALSHFMTVIAFPKKKKKRIVPRFFIQNKNAKMPKCYDVWNECTLSSSLSLCLHSPTLPHAHAVSKDLSWLNMAWHIVAVKTLSKGWFKSPFHWFWIISLFFLFLRHSTHPDKVLNITSQSNLSLTFPTVDYQS